MQPPIDFAVFDTDTVTGTIRIEYGKNQIKTFTVTIATLTWEEWLEAESAIPDPVIPKTKILYDDDGKVSRKVENLEDIDYQRKRIATIWKRNALRVVKSLEKAGAVFEGGREDKIAKVMNNTAVFQGLWSLVNGCANSIYKEVAKTADSFRTNADGDARDENVPELEANPV